MIDAIRTFMTEDTRSGGFEMTAAVPERPGVGRSAPPCMLRNAPFAALIPGDGAVETVLTTGLSSFLSLYNGALIGRILLTWFPNPPQALMGPLSTLCDPYLNLFRGIIPPINGTIDLSPILAFVTLDFFTSSAAALPAELPGRDNDVMARVDNPSRGTRAWRKRAAAIMRKGN